MTAPDGKKLWYLCENAMVCAGSLGERDQTSASPFIKYNINVTLPFD